MPVTSLGMDRQSEMVPQSLGVTATAELEGMSESKRCVKTEGAAEACENLELDFKLEDSSEPEAGARAEELSPEDSQADIVIESAEAEGQDVTAERDSDVRRMPEVSKQLPSDCGGPGEDCEQAALLRPASAVSSPAHWQDRSGFQDRPGLPSLSPGGPGKPDTVAETEAMGAEVTPSMVASGGSRPSSTAATYHGSKPTSAPRLATTATRTDHPDRRPAAGGKEGASDSETGYTAIIDIVQMLDSEGDSKSQLVEACKHAVERASRLQIHKALVGMLQVEGDSESQLIEACKQEVEKASRLQIQQQQRAEECFKLFRDAKDTRKQTVDLRDAQKRCASELPTLLDKGVAMNARAIPLLRKYPQVCTHDAANVEEMLGKRRKGLEEGLQQVQALVEPLGKDALSVVTSITTWAKQLRLEDLELDFAGQDSALQAWLDEIHAKVAFRTSYRLRCCCTMSCEVCCKTSG